MPATADAHRPGVLLRRVAATRLGTTAPYTPAYEGGSCSNTYCHGKFRGGLARTVSWTGTSAAVGCGTPGVADTGGCHDSPPALTTTGAAHPVITACGNCHDGYGPGVVNKTTHLNGQVDACTSCHGTSGRLNGGLAGAAYDTLQSAAPPADTSGASTTGVLVGAHLAHVNPDATGVYKPVACTECHPDNTTGNHPDFTQAEVTFAAATGAILGGFAPTRTLGNRTTTATTCNTYCHDGSAGGTVGTWSWTGAAATCDSCHGDPPTVLSDGATPHSSSTACASCHPGYTSSTVSRATHIDGSVQVSAQT